LSTRARRGNLRDNVAFERTTMKKLLISALGFAFAAGCSGDDSGPKRLEDTSLKNRDSFCKAWADAACNSDVVDACQAPDDDTCMAAQKADCAVRVPVGYVSTNAEKCISAVKRAYQDAELNKTELDLVLNLGGDCSQLVRGAVSAGGDCTLTTECDTTKGYTCVIKGGDAEGTCQIPKIQGPGEPCDEPSQVCDTGAYCDGDNCLVTRPQGKSCTYEAMCSTSDLCDFADATDDPPTGKCAPKLARGTACTTGDECASGICLQGTTKTACADSVKLTFGSPYCATLGGA